MTMETDEIKQPIKVFHVITRMIIGGAQENTLYTVEGLHADTMFDVCLITGPAVGLEGNLLQRARRSGISCRVLQSLRRAVNPVKDAISFFQLLKIFLRQRPDIVHTHSSKAGILGRLAAKLAGVKVIIHTVHGLPFHPYQTRAVNRTYAFLEKLCTRISDKIIVVANAMRDKCLAQHIGTRSKFVRIFSGMEVDTFVKSPSKRDYVRKKLGCSESDFVIAKVARFFPLKGHSDIVTAAVPLCRKFPNIKFLFIGDGMLQKRVKHHIKRAGLDEHCIFAGLVPPSEVPYYFAAADMVVHASYREGLARVIPQGLLAGKPVVSYDVDGAGEVIDDGLNGRLIAPGNIKGLEEGISDVYANYQKYRSYVENDIPSLSSRFSVKKMVEDIIFCYLTFMKNRIK